MSRGEVAKVLVKVLKLEVTEVGDGQGDEEREIHAK